MKGIGEPTRDKIFAMAVAKLRQDFRALEVVPHRGVKGDEAARLVRTFLNDHLPKRFSAGSGFILDRRDQISKQTDVVVYDAMNCPVYRASEEAAIFPADNVAAVVEVKSRLDGEKLAEAAKNIGAAKALAKAKPPEGPFLVQAQTMGCVFAFESAISVDTLLEHYRQLLFANGLGHHIDLILVLDRAVLTLAAKPRGHEWAACLLEGLGGPESEGSHLAVGALELGEASLDAFLRLFLPHLIFFRGMVDHPGFGRPGDQMKLVYLTSITSEKDPAKKDLKLKQYRAEVEAEFRSPLAPPRGGPA